MKTQKENAQTKKVAGQVKALMAQARAAEARDCPALAARLLLSVLSLAPTRDTARYRAAMNLLEVGRVAEAEKQLKAINDIPLGKQWLIELLAGRIAMEQFKPRSAEKHFREALRLRPSSTVPAVFLAACLRRREKFKESVQVLKDALAAEGDIDEVDLNLGLIFRALGDFAAAKKCLLNALAITPDYTDVKRVLADVEACVEYENQEHAK